MQICLGRCHIVIWHCRHIFFAFNIITNIKLSFPLGLTSSSHSTSSSIQHQHQDVLSPGLGLGVRSSTLHPPAFGIPVPFATRQIWVQDPPRNTHTQIHFDAHSTNYPWTAKSVTKLISSNLLIVYHCTLETRWAPRIFTCGLLIGPNPVQVPRVLRANR